MRTVDDYFVPFLKREDETKPRNNSNFISIDIKFIDGRSLILMDVIHIFVGKELVEILTESNVELKYDIEAVERILSHSILGHFRILYPERSR